MKILVVDDDNEVRKNLAGYLNQWGHTVVSAASGKEALFKLDKEGFDVVILDIIMPGIHGLDVLSFIRNKKFDVKVIMLADVTEGTLIKKSMELGASLVLKKPVSIVELSKNLDKVFTEIRGSYITFKEQALIFQKEIKIYEEIFNILQIESIPPKIFTSLLNILRNIVECEYAWLISEDPKGEGFFIEYVAGFLKFKYRKNLRDINVGFTGRVYNSEEPIFGSPEEVLKDELPDEVNIKSIAGCTVLLKNRKIGVLIIANKKTGFFVKEDLKSLEIMSKGIAISLKEGWLQENLTLAMDEITEKELKIEELEALLKKT